LAKSTHHEAPRYAIFSFLQSLHPTSVQLSSDIYGKKRVRECLEIQYYRYGVENLSSFEGSQAVPASLSDIKKYLRDGKALGSKEGKVAVSGICCDEGKGVGAILSVVRILILNVK
jgi:hypothetical protein